MVLISTLCTRSKKRWQKRFITTFEMISCYPMLRRICCWYGLFNKVVIQHSKLIKTWLEGNQVSVMKWLIFWFKSHWKLVAWDKKDNSKGENKAQLWQKIRKRYNISKSICEHLMDSMSCRCQANLRNKGYAIKY